MRTLAELIDQKEPAWPYVLEWIAQATVNTEMLPTDIAHGEAALFGAQVTSLSPMGAVALNSAGILIDHGWLRVLGAGGNPRFQRSLPSWNQGRSNGFYLVADDAVGGAFALNGGALGPAPGNVYFFAPETLQWEPLGFGYSQFLVWAMSTNLRDFYASLRWEGWEEEVEALTADQAISIYPFLFTEGPPLVERSRRPVPVAEQYDLSSDLQRQIRPRNS